MSDLTILCETEITPHERAVLDMIASARHTTRESVIREAVAIFAAARRSRAVGCASVKGGILTKRGEPGKGR